VEVVSYTQDSIWDKIMGKGDLLIRLAHGVELPFAQVSRPKTCAKKILKLKEHHTLLQEGSQKKQPEDQFSLITEALSEVVKEYLEKRQDHEKL
jgi:hypothetical protein